jgi:lactoylglutathione lyase
MKYVHTMVRITDITISLDFYCNKLGLVEVHRHDNEAGKYTNIFLAAQTDTLSATQNNAPLLELTYNWPDKNGNQEAYFKGRNFGHLAYEVENIYETCEKLQSMGVVINRPPRDGRMAFINSPDNISIELLQKGEALPQSEPWVSKENVGSW